MLAATVVALVAPGRAAAGPWTPEAGHGYGKIWIKWLPTFGLFDYTDGGGDTHAYADYQEIFLAAYAEVGLYDEGDFGLAATLHTDLLRVFVLEDPRTSTHYDHVAPGDPALGLRLRFLRRGRFVMAIEGSARAPLASGDVVQDVVGTDAGNPIIGGLRVGAGVWDLAGSLSAGYGFGVYYVAGGAGYVGRTGDYDHAVTWSLEGGGSFPSGFSIRGRLTGYHSLGNGDPALLHSSPSGIGSGTSYMGFAVETDWRVTTSLYLGVTIEGGLFYIRRQTGGPVLSLYAAVAI